MCPTRRKWGVSRDYDDATTRADEPGIIFNLVLNDNWNYMLPPQHLFKKRTTAVFSLDV